MSKPKIDITNLDPNKVFFTSDTHFNHKNILSYCYRPFDTIEEHDETLIRNWNNVVPEDGVVFHLGDFGTGNIKYLKKVFNRLNGTIYLCVGNHDFTKVRTSFKKVFAEQRLQYNLYINKQHIILNHRPFLCLEGSNHNSVWNLFGHVHSGPNANGMDIPRLEYLFPCQYDVGVDNNNYAPISFLQVKEKITEQINNSKKLMFNRLTYKLTHVAVTGLETIDGCTAATTVERNYGFFDSERAAEAFIEKHKTESYNGFYILEAWVKEPTHVDQCETSLFERTYDKDGNLLCSEAAFRFIPNQHEVLAENYVRFKGRDNLPIKKGMIAMFYDWHSNMIAPCQVCEVPFSTEDAKKYENLDYMDDSYLIHPLPIPETDNHDHILSCFMFTNEQFKKMIENNE